jgi:hypothetical protein
VAGDTGVSEEPLECLRADTRHSPWEGSAGRGGRGLLYSLLCPRAVRPQRNRWYRRRSIGNGPSGRRHRRRRGRASEMTALRGQRECSGGRGDGTRADGRHFCRHVPSCFRAALHGCRGCRRRVQADPGASSQPWGAKRRRVGQCCRIDRSPVRRGRRDQGRQRLRTGAPRKPCGCAEELRAPLLSDKRCQARPRGSSGVGSARARLRRVVPGAHWTCPIVASCRNRRRSACSRSRMSSSDQWN